MKFIGAIRMPHCNLRLLVASAKTQNLTKSAAFPQFYQVIFNFQQISNKSFEETIILNIYNS